MSDRNCQFLSLLHAHPVSHSNCLSLDLACLSPNNFRCFLYNWPPKTSCRRHLRRDPTSFLLVHLALSGPSLSRAFLLAALFHFICLFVSFCVRHRIVHSYTFVTPFNCGKLIYTTGGSLLSMPLRPSAFRFAYN